MLWWQVGFILVVVWLLLLSFISFFVYRHLRILLREYKEESLIKVLDSVLKKLSDQGKKIDILTSGMDKLGGDAVGHFQKIGLVRFNPFNETGGNYSFCLALLDGDNNGFVMTTLHARERTRLYLKSVKKGQSDVEFSKEEKEVVEKAKKQKIM